MPPKNNLPPPSPEEISGICSRLGFSLLPEQSVHLSIYLDILVKWNKVMNLVGRSAWPEILEHLVVDSFHLADFILPLDFAESPECWDLGAGAGLPGIPLRIIWQKGTYSLIESREKRGLFLQTVLASCPLPGVQVFMGRAENFMLQRPPADLIVSRAFMPWEKMLDLVKPYTTPGSICLFLTLAPVPPALPTGWTADAEKMYMTGRDTRYLWAIRRC